MFVLVLPNFTFLSIAALFFFERRTASPRPVLALGLRITVRVTAKPSCTVKVRGRLRVGVRS